jgi:hypothetical protein
MFNFGDVSRVAGSQGDTATGTGLQQVGDRNSVVNFLRPEDGHWDPTDPRTVYWLTTDTLTTSGGVSRIYKMTFNNILQPELGGTMSIVGESTAASYAGGLLSPTGATTMEMADNMTAYTGLDGVTRLLIQEDVGGSSRLGRLWQYNTATDTLVEVAINNASLFTGSAATNPNFLTLDEETSGIIEAPWLGHGWFIMNMQAHYSIGGELVEGGQLMAIYVPDNVAVPEPTGLAMLSLAGAMVLRRRR